MHQPRFVTCSFRDRVETSCEEFEISESYHRVLLSGDVSLAAGGIDNTSRVDLVVVGKVMDLPL